MEFIEQLTAMEISPGYLAAGAIFLLVLSLVIFRPRRANTYPSSPIISKTPVKSAETVPTVKHTKDSYGGELTTATLILGSSKEKVTLSKFIGFEWDPEVGDVILEKDSTQNILCLGEHDLFIGKGLPERCDFTDSYPLRIWARGEVIYEGRLADVEYESRKVTGYDQTGADVTILLGPGLSMFLE